MKAAYAGLGVALGVGVYFLVTTRGIRNNNPGNLKKTSDQWLGLAAIQYDPTFFVFKKPVYGIRALARLLQNYELAGFDTVSKIIHRYAPTSENDTAAYIESVSNRLGVNQNKVIDVNEVLPELIKAIVTHENGKQPYSDQTIAAAIRMA